MFGHTVCVRPGQSCVDGDVGGTKQGEDIVKLGVILPTFVYDNTRAALAAAMFPTLLNTRIEGLTEKPMLTIMYKPPSVPFTYPTDEQFNEKFVFERLLDPPEVSGVDQTLAWGTTHMFDNGADTVTWLGDDSLLHPDWLFQLEALINRHPEARAWSVYRSAYEMVHRTLWQDEEGSGDVRVRSIGYTLTFSKKEWRGWGVDWRRGYWDCADGNTLDLCHIHDRPGERWVTGVSYAQHTGRWGVHCRPEIPEYAVAFQGVGA